MGLHRSGVLLGPELAIADMLSRPADATKVVSDAWQYVFVFILALGVAWMTLMTTRRARLGSIVAILLV